MLDVPGGLKIQTIHAFCQSLLARFPLEAGIAPRFQAADERTAAETLAGAREAILAGVRMQGPAAPVAQALAEVSGHVDAAGFGDLMDQVARTRARLRAVLDRHGGLDGALSGVRTRLALGPEETLASLRHAAAEDGTFDRPGLDAVAQAMAKGSATDRARARIIMSWLDGPAGRADRLERYCEVFLTQTEELRRRLATKAVEEECPGALDILAREGEHLLGVRARIRAATVAQATGALLTLGERMLEVYERRLRAAGWLDYDDLIHLAGRLLSTPGEAAWVLYKLDGGLDHLLVDEAQDTNPQQWAVIAALTEEFFAGEGARDTERTVFAVGDPKQSIYGFQGADPAAFETNQARFRTRSEDAGRPWRSVRLDRSYRSTEAVLRAVDATFARADAAAGVGAVGERVRHAWARRGEAGLVELWPVAPPAEKAAVAAWTPAAPSAATKLPRTRLAHLLAHKIAVLDPPRQRRPRGPARGPRPGHGARRRSGPGASSARHSSRSWCAR